MRYKKWTQEEIDVLILKYPDSHINELCALLGRTSKSIYMKATIMGISKSDKYMEESKKCRIEMLTRTNIDTRFKKGCIPHNKGIKMSSKWYEKAKHTFFKKGNVPANIKYDGHERIQVDGYTSIRVNGKYVYKNRYLYEKSGNVIPDGYKVVFKDGDKSNFDLDNLECISSKEMMSRNTIHMYPKRLKELIILNNKLKRKIYATKQN